MRGILRNPIWTLIWISSTRICRGGIGAEFPMLIFISLAEFALHSLLRHKQNCVQFAKNEAIIAKPKAKRKLKLGLGGYVVTLRNKKYKKIKINKENGCPTYLKSPRTEVTGFNFQLFRV